MEKVGKVATARNSWQQFLACNSFKGEKKDRQQLESRQQPDVRNSSPKSTTVVKGCHVGAWVWLPWFGAMGKKIGGFCSPLLLVNEFSANS